MWSRRHQGVDKAFTPAILEEGITYKPIGFDNKQIQFSDIREMNRARDAHLASQGNNLDRAPTRPEPTPTGATPGESEPGPTEVRVGGVTVRLPQIGPKTPRDSALSQAFRAIDEIEELKKLPGANLLPEKNKDRASRNDDLPELFSPMRQTKCDRG